MSRSTPRKSRHRHSASGGGGAGGHGSRNVAASDYESDAAQYMETRGAPQLPPNRTNTELNLSVLQRYLPNITSIASMAANAVVYTFDPIANGWEKAGVEGTMFVCDQEPLSAVPGLTSRLPRSCVIVLNRRALENIVIDLAVVSQYEITGDLLMFKLEQADGEAAAAGDKVIGLWIHADQRDTRESNIAIIRERWSQVRAAGEVVGNAEHGTAFGVMGATEGSIGPAMQAMGRKLSLSDLFGRHVEGNHDSTS